MKILKLSSKLTNKRLNYFKGEFNSTRMLIYRSHDITIMLDHILITEKSIIISAHLNLDYGLKYVVIHNDKELLPRKTIEKIKIKLLEKVLENKTIEQLLEDLINKQNFKGSHSLTFKDLLQI